MDMNIVVDISNISKNKWQEIMFNQVKLKAFEAFMDEKRSKSKLCFNPIMQY